MEENTKCIFSKLFKQTKAVTNAVCSPTASELVQHLSALTKGDYGF